jgi:DNA-binding transcriptional regulator YbjK
VTSAIEVTLGSVTYYLDAAKIQKNVCTAKVQTFFYRFRQDLKAFRRNLNSEYEIQAIFDDIQTSPTTVTLGSVTYYLITTLRVP